MHNHLILFWASHESHLRGKSREHPELWFFWGDTAVLLQQDSSRSIHLDALEKLPSYKLHHRHCQQRHKMKNHLPPNTSEQAARQGGELINPPCSLPFVSQPSQNIQWASGDSEDRFAHVYTSSRTGSKPSRNALGMSVFKYTLQFILKKKKKTIRNFFPL